MTTNTPTHTPTPWKAEGWKNTVVNGADGSTIVAAPGTSTGTLIEMQANAAHIVQCVNERAELLEALTRINDCNCLSVFRGVISFPDGSTLDIGALLARAEEPHP
jgi:hypothetical protein